MLSNDYECEGQLNIFDVISEQKKPDPEEAKDEYIKENPTCFYVYGHYLDKTQGWHKVPDELPTFKEWKKIDVVLFGKMTNTPWMELGTWEAKDWTFRSIDTRRDTETITVLAWKLADDITNPAGF